MKIRIPSSILKFARWLRRRHVLSETESPQQAIVSEIVARKPVQSASASSMSIETGISLAESMAQIERIAASPVLRHAPRLKALLKHIGNYSLQKQPESLKEIVIAVEVFGIAASTFNSKIDNVVRVNAGRLRSKLAEYYMYHGGPNDRIVVTIPTGHYRAEFKRRKDGGRSDGGAGGSFNEPSDPDNSPQGRIAAPLCFALA